MYSIVEFSNRELDVVDTKLIQKKGDKIFVQYPNLRKKFPALQVLPDTSNSQEELQKKLDKILEEEDEEEEEENQPPSSDSEPDLG